VPTLFRRKSTAVVIDSSEPTDAPESGVRSKNYTPSKRELGVVTPKRTGTNLRKLGAPPVDRKTATAQSRATAREARMQQRSAMMEGQESALTARDRGPERRLVRNIVDSRRNLGEYVFFGIIFFFVLSVVAGRNEQAAFWTEMILVFMLLVVAVDSVFLVRHVKSVVRERFPDSSTRGLAFYAVMRAASFRRMRIPKPQVTKGQKV
jgi:hypothetical protein